MTLPEPAATLWRKHHAAVRRVAAEPDAESRLLIGGGTVLAARWEHRRSTDIDLFLPDRENVNDLRRGGALDLAAATGGVEVFSSDRQVTVQLPEGELDVSASTPRLPGLETDEAIDGTRVTVLDSAQILLGKFYRTHRETTRDAFDLAVAARAQPRALAIAVNALSPEEARVIGRTLERRNEHMVSEAHHVLAGVPACYEDIRKRLGHAAADGLRDHRYESLKIRISRTGILIETRTRGRRDWSQEYAGRAERALVQSGAGIYLRRNSSVGPRRLGKAVDELRRRGWTGTVFDSVERRPENRLRTALADAEMRSREP